MNLMKKHIFVMLSMCTLLMMGHQAHAAGSCSARFPDSAGVDSNAYDQCIREQQISDVTEKRKNGGYVTETQLAGCLKAGGTAAECYGTSKSASTSSTTNTSASTGISSSSSSSSGGCSASDRASGAKCIDLDQEEMASNSTSSSSGCGQTGAKCVDLGSDDDGYGAGNGAASGGGSGTSNGSGYVSDSDVQGSGTFNTTGYTGAGVAGATTWTKGIKDLVTGQAQKAAAKPGYIAAGAGGGSGGGGLLGGLGGGGALGGLIDTSAFSGALQNIDKIAGQVNQVASFANKLGIQTPDVAKLTGQITGATKIASNGLAMVNNAGTTLSGLAGKAPSIGDSITSLASKSGNLNLGNSFDSVTKAGESLKGLTSGGSLNLASAKDTLKQVQAGVKNVQTLTNQAKTAVASAEELAKKVKIPGGGG